MVGFLLAEALRDLRRAGRVAVSAIVLITLSMAAVGGFWLVTSNLGDATTQWRDRVRIIVYLKQEPPDHAIPELMARVLGTPGVANATYVTRTQALISLRRMLGRDAGVLEQLSANPLSASVEVTPSAEAATRDKARRLLQRLSSLPEAEEVSGSVDWVERLSQWKQLLALIGFGIGTVFALAAILSVTTATTLVLHARRHETEIMRLVGAPEFVIRVPLLLQGMLQGLLGAAIAVLVLVAAYRIALPHLEPLVDITIGLPGLSFLPPHEIAALIATGTLLGAFGGWLALPIMSAYRIVALLLLASIAAATIIATGGVAAAQAPKKDEPLQAEQRKLQQTQKQLREERERAAEARKRETSLLAELEQIERRLGEKQRDVLRLDERMRRVQGEIQALRTDIDRLRGQRTDQEDALARRLRAMYRMHAQGGALPLILSSEDAVTRAIAVRHLARVAALDARLIQEYRVTSDRLVDKRSREEAREQELATLRADAKREQAEVDREAGKRRTLLARVRDERAYHERMVGELTEAAQRLEAFVRDLQARQRRLAKIPPPKGGIEPPATGFGALRGRLPWPTDGRIVTAFGPQVHPRFATRTFRNGVDIEAVEGTDVGAVYPGHVIYTGWFKGYGNLIILDHGSEYYTLYAHVAEILVKEGDDVRQGQRIGTVGDTGSLAGARLYFELRYQGKPQDPEQWLRQRS